MATHELYLGGGRTTNTDGAQFPSPAFTQTGTIVPAGHKGNNLFSLTRVFDFRDDPALKQYASDATFAAGDYLGAVLIPDNCLLIGVHWAIERAVAGVTLLVRLRTDNSTLVTTIDGGTVAEGFSTPNAANFVSGTPTAVQALFLSNGDIVDMELDALPAGGVGTLRVAITPVVLDFKRGQW